MYVSARDRRILDELLAHPEGVTVAYLAEALDVSERTIHRDLTTFDSLLQPYELTLEKKSGTGLRLSGPDSELQTLTNDLSEARSIDFLPEQRQLLLSYKLLTATEPVKLQALASELHITEATVRNDLDKLTSWMEDHQLTLLRRRGFGIQAAGEEASKRRAIRALLADHLNDTDLLRFIRRRTLAETGGRTKAIADQLLGFVDEERIQEVEQAVEEVNRQLPVPIADSSYAALVVHLTLALERIQLGERVQMKEELLARLRDKQEFPLAASLAARLEERLSLSIPETEIGYITMHLRGAKLQRDTQFQADPDLDISFLAGRLIRHVSDRYGTTFAGHALEQGLTAHLSPALYRMQQQMSIHNPLKETIQSKYPELFNAVQDAAGHVFADLPVPEDEVGFLVLHFGSALELDDGREYHAYVICSTGIGSSKMMAARLKREFPQITSMEQLSVYELEQKQLDPGDLIISTIALDEQYDHIQVNPFVTEEELAAIERYMGRKPGKREQPQQSEPEGSLESMQSQLNAALHLMQHVELIQESTSVPFWTSLYNTLLYLQGKGFVGDAEAVTRALQERTKLSGVGLPNTQLALYHARTSEVREPVFLILERIQEEPVQAMDGSTIYVRRILLMLAPQQMNEIESSMLSRISSMIVKNDTSLRLFAEGTEKDVKDFMSGEFLQLIRGIN
ncbi:BglG family transcription antiterminator [Alkalicoccus luteus]|uniref:Transcription antiterminator n=1 Tax=Alkalicoccus luteus TaxID=1237094 RepID=A0A969PL14_9BACI|nr:BglG family transcription antiterminator [Alkalicoccus luteus]NJP36155.1 transcription antiterminator [Alkalicoccus luteus]